MRQMVENSFSISKKRFACLEKLRVSPVFASEIIKCCCILHNFLLKADPENSNDEEEMNIDPNIELKAETEAGDEIESINNFCSIENQAQIGASGPDDYELSSNTRRVITSPFSKAFLISSWRLFNAKNDHLVHILWKKLIEFKMEIPAEIWATTMDDGSQQIKTL
uniref:DDE Tnp4 domain-containing protein n=1 Tax=Romanomermis culicivorax TaxID=13658 RepID=A0A915HFK4_ROMCU